MECNRRGCRVQILLGMVIGQLVFDFDHFAEKCFTYIRWSKYRGIFRPLANRLGYFSSGTQLQKARRPSLWNACLGIGLTSNCISSSSNWKFSGAVFASSLANCIFERQSFYTKAVAVLYKSLQSLLFSCNQAVKCVIIHFFHYFFQFHCFSLFWNRCHYFIIF